MTQKPLHILVVEDDELLRTQLGQSLVNRGHHPVLAAGLHEALRILTEPAELDVAILDLNLEQHSGLDLIEPILQHSPTARVLILTGYGSIPTAVAATRRGAWNYLTKPATCNDILHALSDDPASATPQPPSDRPTLLRLEWEHISRVLDDHGGNISAASRALGIHRRTLQRRLKKRPSPTEFSRDRQQ